MTPLLREIRRNPLLWLLAFIPVVFAAQKLRPDAPTLLFALSVLAIVPLAALLSHATESVAVKTGDTVGGMLNATLGNLTELVIALAALQAGEYTLVKASIAGAIVTNTLFMLGASFLLGGLRHHVQEFNRVNARLQAGLLFLATVALLVPSATSGSEPAPNTVFVQQLSVGLSVLLIAAYGLGLLFTLKTHREIFGSSEHGEGEEAPWPLGLALATLAGVTVLVALVSEVFVESVQDAALSLGLSQAFVGFIVVAGGCGGGNGGRLLGRAEEPARLERGDRARERLADRALRRAGPRAAELCDRPGAHDAPVLAGCRRNDAHRHDDGGARDQQRPVGLVRRRACADGLSGVCHDAVLAAASRVATPRSRASMDGVSNPCGALAPGACPVTALRTWVVATRPRRRRRADRDARAVGIAYAEWASRVFAALRDDRADARICHLRSSRILTGPRLAARGGDFAVGCRCPRAAPTARWRWPA
jgi:Ca2+:H+ antiporter